MKTHLKYLSYVVRHKWFVLRACWRRGLYWQGIVHDFSKFRPSEWFAYAQFFYGVKPTDAERDRATLAIGHDPYPTRWYFEVALPDDFDRAWLCHQHRNPHHWQHWILREDSGETKILAMPRRYAIEMVCDWEGAGRAITGKAGGTAAWYLKNRERIQLHPSTRAHVELLLELPYVSPDHVTV